ncbi:MAG: redoxin domain-containing protein [Thermoplasmata archaeon]|nr:redoxin domain-containing protein [Thermoplasmata archaeon]
MSKRSRNKKNGSGRRRRSSRAPPPSFWAANQRTVIGVAFIIVLIITVAYVVANQSGDDPPETGDKEPAPDFSILSIDGAPVRLDAYRGRVVVLDLFATWCGPCRTQMGELNQLRAVYAGSEVEILSVDVDPKETNQQIRDFRDEFNADWTFSSDTDNLNQKYDASSIPTMVVIDQDGNMVFRNAGVTTFSELQAIIEPLLQGAA